MSTVALTRRELRFETLDDARRDVRHLLAVGYDKAGNWSLGQACHHLAVWVRYPLDGFPALPAWQRPLAWAIRNTVGPSYTRRVMASGKVPSGIPAPLDTTPPATVADADGVTQYEAHLDRLRDFRGVPHRSPLLGTLSNAELKTLSCVHAAHHLSFLAPRRAES